MADLTETTLAYAVGAGETSLRLTSVTGVVRGYSIYLDGEETRAVSAPLGLTVRVMRGVGGRASAHAAGVSVFIAPSHRLHSVDPQGVAQAAPDDNPWINVPGGRVWRAQGDAAGPGASNRYWELVTTTRAVGALGVRANPVSTPSS